MTKAYLIYKCVGDKETLMASAPNLRDVLAVGSTTLNTAIMKGQTKPEFKVQSCEINNSTQEVEFKTLPLDIQVASKIVTKDNAA